MRQQRAEITPSAANTSVYALPTHEGEFPSSLPPAPTPGSKERPIPVERESRGQPPAPASQAENTPEVQSRPRAPLDPAWRVVRTPTEDFQVFYGNREFHLPLEFSRDAWNVISFFKRQGLSEPTILGFCDHFMPKGHIVSSDMEVDDPIPPPDPNTSVKRKAKAPRKYRPPQPKPEAPAGEAAIPSQPPTAPETVTGEAAIPH